MSKRRKSRRPSANGLARRGGGEEVALEGGDGDGDGLGLGAAALDLGPRGVECGAERDAEGSRGRDFYQVIPLPKLLSWIPR